MIDDTEREKREAQGSGCKALRAVISPSDLVSDDGAVTIQHDELLRWQAELPHIKNMRGQVLFTLRALNHVRKPEVRLRYLYERLAHAEQIAIEREEARA